MWAAMGARDGNPGRQKPFAGSAGSNAIGDHAWYRNYFDHTTHPVGTKTANEVGLHDMSGNVCEWCWDWHADNGTWPYYAITGAVTNYRGAAWGSSRVLRGASWNTWQERFHAVGGLLVDGRHFPGALEHTVATFRSRQQFVILGMRPDPEPHDALRLLRTQRSVVCFNTD
jgi:hypothetical protein